MLPSILCCKWVKSPRPTCGPWLHTTDPWTCPSRAPQGHHPHKIPMKDHPHTLPWTSVPPLPTYFGDACGFLVLGRQSSSLLLRDSSLLVSSWVMVAWPCYCTDQWSCLGTCISCLHLILEYILTESNCLCQDTRNCTASF